MLPIEITGYFSPTKYSNRADLCTDIVILKLREKTILEDIEKWKSLKRKVYISVSLTKGEFPEYFQGQYDDINHDEEIQRDITGNKILHGPGVPYVFPTLSYMEFLVKKIDKCIDKNVDGIILTEPFLSLYGGYCKPFKNEWEAYYKSPFIYSNSERITDRFKRNKLKALIINNAIAYLGYAIREYSYSNPYYTDNKNMLKILVQVKSLMSNKKDYCIGSVGKLVNNLQIDGFIGKPVKQNQCVAIDDGHKSNKSFELSFLAYSYFSELSLNNDKEVWLPILMKEKDFNTDWSSITEHFKTSLVASVMTSKKTKYLFWGDADELYNRSFLQIPKEYSTMIHVAQNAMKSIFISKEKTEYVDEPSVGIIVGDGVLYENGYPEDDIYYTAYQDDIECSSAFYGLAFPFLDMGIRVTPVPDEQITHKDDYINDYNILILSYEFFKPESHSLHYILKEWVRTGGILIVLGNDEDSYNSSDGWWKHTNKPYSSPLDHLFDVLNVKGINTVYKKFKNQKSASNSINSVFNYPVYEYDAGLVLYLPINPILFAREPNYKKAFTKTVTKAAEKKDILFKKKDYMFIQKGEYRLYHTNSSAEPLRIKGKLIDLFSPQLDYVDNTEIAPGQPAFFYDIDEMKSDDVGVIAIGASVSNYESNPKKIRFTAKSPEGYIVPCRIYFPYSCIVNIDKKRINFARDKSGETIFFEFEGMSEGRTIELERI